MSLNGKWLHAFAASAGALSMLTASGGSAIAYRAHDDHVLGTSLDVVAVADGAGTAAIAVTAVRSTIQRLEKVLSHHDSMSELSMLNRSVGPVRVSPELFAVVQAAESWRTKTEMAFSGRLGRVQAAWEARAIAGSDVTSDLSTQAANARVLLDPLTCTISRSDECVFALDGIAKGFIIDRAVQAACWAAPSLQGLLVDIGGDVRVWGRPTKGDAWRIGVAGTDLDETAEPAITLGLRDAAIASSGRGARDLSIDGVLHTHIFDPRTGEPVRDVHRATVVANNAMTADALATAAVVMGGPRAIAMIDALPQTEAALTLSDGTTLASRGWASLITRVQSKPAAATPLRLAQTSVATSPEWPAGFSAVVNYEVPNLPSDNYRSPYLTIWITNEQRELVKTLLVLGNETRYIDSNFVWWRRYGRKDTALVDAIARPTRAPGRYTASWDGRDDTGRLVPQGRYLVHVEATREHGGHSYESGEISIGPQPAELSLPQKDEVGPLHLRYGPAI